MSTLPVDLTAFAIITVTVAVLGVAAIWLKQPTLVAYIVAGIVIGPAFLDLVQPTPFIADMSELGLAFLLFLIGMEMNVREVKHMLRSIMKTAAGMMLSLSLFGMLVAMLLGFPPVAAAVIGFATMYGSTAVVMKLLTDKHENTLTSGKLHIGVLLTEDIVVIILMALLTAQVTTWQGFAVSSLLILVTLLLIAVIAVGSARSVFSSVFRHMSENPHYLFVIGLGWCFLFMYAAEYARLSPEIGAFLAGLGLAQLPYTMELRERVRPLTEFLMALFFVNFGLNITLQEFTFYWQEALIAAVLLMAGKFLVIFTLVKWQRYSLNTSFKVGINMTQTSEFSIIFGTVAASAPLTAEYIGQEVVGFLSIIAITTMGLSSYLVLYNNQIFDQVQPYLESVVGKQRKMDVERQQFSDHAVILGYTEVSKTVIPLITDHVDTVVVVDRDPDTADELEESPYFHVFGDFHHRELREEAHIGEASIVLSLSEEYEVNQEILEETAQADIRILSAALETDRDRLYEQGANHVLLEHELAGKTLATRVRELLDQPDQKVTGDE